MSTRFVLSEDALEDVDELWKYIAVDSFTAANRVKESLYRAFEVLSDQPHMGHTRRDLTDRHLKFWPVYSYLIVYDPETSPLYIVRVLHGARDISARL